MFMQCGGLVLNKGYVSKCSSVTGDSSEQVGLNIPLRFIFKLSYSPHSINTNDIYDLNKEPYEDFFIEIS